MDSFRRPSTQFTEWWPQGAFPPAGWELLCSHPPGTGPSLLLMLILVGVIPPAAAFSLHLIKNLALWIPLTFLTKC